MHHTQGSNNSSFCSQLPSSIFHKDRKELHMHTPNLPLPSFSPSHFHLLINISPTEFALQLSKIFLTGMDWYSWLSKTGLDDPLLVYQYGRALTHNELQEEDVTYFSHEFLQSMGISVAKHRLEILKLAGKEVGGSPNIRSSRLVWAISKTKRLFTKLDFLYLRPGRSPWTRSFRKQTDKIGPKEQKIEGQILTKKSLMRSGPLERIGEEGLMVKSRTLSISGPLDRKLQERLTSTNWSPTASGSLYGRPKASLVYQNRIPKVSQVLDRSSNSSPMVGSHYKIKETMDAEYDGLPSVWSLMFQDLKPT